MPADSWRHHLCPSCWLLLEPAREPIMLSEPEPPVSCCRCGELTISPVYIRRQPHAFPCRGFHPGKARPERSVTG